MFFGINQQDYRGNMTETNMFEFKYDKDISTQMTSFLREHENFKRVMDILTKLHSRNKSFFDVENLKKYGFDDDFLVQVYDYNAPSAVFIPVFCDTARAYGFPANVALLGIAEEQGLINDRVSDALKKIKVPTAA